MMKGKDHKAAVLILAAGKGTRMRSNLPKVLHLLDRRPLLTYVLEAARDIGPERIVVVVGYGADAVREAYAGQNLIFVEQSPQLGTGHAVLTAQGAFADFHGPVLLLCGDVPLLTSDTLRRFLDFHHRRQAVLTLLTARLADPAGYGRVIKDGEGALLRIVEDRDATPEEKSIKEINTGTYCVDSSFLFAAAGRLGQANAQREYYLTDIIGIGRNLGVPMCSYVADHPEELMGINSPADLRQAEIILANRSKS